MAALTIGSIICGFMGDISTSPAWTEGRGMDIDQAIGFAMKGVG